MQYQFQESMGRVTQELSKAIGRLLVQNFKNAGFNTTSSEWVAITYLANNQRLNQQSLAELIVRDKVAVKRILDKLQKEGLIIRDIDPKDRRSNLIILTDKGKELYHLLEPIAGKTLETAYQGIDQLKIKNSLSTMKEIMINIEQKIKL